MTKQEQNKENDCDVKLKLFTDFISDIRNSISIMCALLETFGRKYIMHISYTINALHNKILNL